MSVLGTGIDVVDLDGFRRQLDDRASGFVAATFTLGEQRDAERPSGDRIARLAARFAAKEAFLKAWSGARRGRPPTLSAVDLRQIEVVLDGYDRPAIRTHGPVTAAVAALGGAAGDPVAHLSMSHDGAVATAFVVLSRD